MRQIVLDTETTGLEPDTHRVIEIGCVEIVNRRLTGNRYHQYINPEREIDEGALQVHGLSTEFLSDKPVFAEVVDSFLEFVKGAELVIHNAPFDVGFLNAELQRLGPNFGNVSTHCSVLDTLMLARKMRPGQKNSLDALCRFYEVDNSHRDLHGALLDAEILAEVYLRMTGGQVSLSLAGQESQNAGVGAGLKRLSANRAPLPVLRASEAELQAHEQYLQMLDKASGDKTLWRQNAQTPTVQ